VELSIADIKLYREGMKNISNKSTFDWVHMRSVLDHFQDPYLALKEAYRVLRFNGTLLIGLAVRGGKSLLKTDNSHDNVSQFVSIISRVKTKFRYVGLTSFVRRGVRKVIKKEEKNMPDDHMFCWIYGDLIDLIRTAGFRVIKEHWQKPPFTMCIYLSAKKRS